MPELTCSLKSTSTKPGGLIKNTTKSHRAPLELGEVRGIVSGNFGEVSEDTHALVAALATCRVRVAGVSRGRKGNMRTEEGERSLAISGLRRRLGVLTVKCQAHSLLGRLEALGPGSSAAAGRR